MPPNRVAVASGIADENHPVGVGFGERCALTRKRTTGPYRSGPRNRVTPRQAFGVKRLDSMRDTYQGKYEKTVKDILFLARQRLDTDGALAASLRRSDNTVLAITYGLNQAIQRGSLTSKQQTLESFAFADYPASAEDWSAFIPSILTQDVPVLTQAQAPIPMLAKHSVAGMLDESVNGDSLLGAR